MLLDDVVLDGLIERAHQCRSGLLVSHWVGIDQLIGVQITGAIRC